MVRTSDKLCWISTFELSMTRLPVARVCEGSDTERNLVHLPLISSRNQSAKSNIKVANLRAPPCTAVEPPCRSVYFRGLKRKSEITKAKIRKSLGPEISYARLARVGPLARLRIVDGDTTPRGATPSPPSRRAWLRYVKLSAGCITRWARSRSPMKVMSTYSPFCSIYVSIL